ncbi:hypothetical protein Tco_0304134 [Tanacetum coccineum]
MSTIDSLKSILTQSALDALCEKFYIPDAVHPELPGPNARIRNSPTGKIGVYSRFFDFANYWIPLSQFLVDILQYFQINLSQLSVIAAAKVSHFEILCRVHGFIPTVGNFHRFYINSKNKGWMSFSKSAENASVCYSRPLDLLKNWSDHFFWVDASVLPHATPWHSSKTVSKDPHPTPNEFDADVCNYLADNRAPFRKFPEPFLCLVGISRYYTSDEDSYPTFWADEDEEMDLFAFIRHADPTKVKIGERKVREGEVSLLELTRERVILLAGVNNQGGAAAQVDAEAQALVANKPKKFRKRMTADGASGPGHPPKKLKEDHGTSGDAGASTAGKSLAALQDLLDKSTLAAEIGVTAAATVPFVTSSVTPTPEHEGGEYTDFVSAANFRTKRPTKRFVISSDTSPDSNANATDDEVSSVVKSVVLDPAVLTTTVATTVVADTSVPQPMKVNKPARASIFADSTSADMDSETLHQTYVPKWDVLNESALDKPNVCRSLVDQLAPLVFFSQLRAMEYDQLFAEFNVGATRQTFLVEVAETIRLRSRIANIKAADTTLTGELKSLKEQNATLESAAASILECEKDKLVNQVSELEAICSGLHDEVAGYKLFKEQVEAMQDEQVRVLSDRVSNIDSDLMDMAMHMDEEFYPRYLTTIAGRRWILSRGLKLVIMKCLQSSEYMSDLGGALGRAIDKGMHDGLKSGVDHGRAGRGLDDIAAYDPSVEANFVYAIDALRAVNFPLLAQLESRKDASMADVFDLLRLEGPAAETPEASQLQPSFEQLMVPIHWLKDQVIIGETSLSFALDVAHSRVQRLKGDTAACRMSLIDIMVSLLEPLSVRSLTGEANTSMVPSTAMTTDLSTTFVQASTILPVPSTEVPPSSKIVFEEKLDTVPEHASAP